jgi:hypothetical protein
MEPRIPRIGFVLQEGRSMRRVILFAIAFAAAGAASGQDSTAVRQAPSLPGAVDPKPTPAISEGNSGLASKYPGDVGIEKDPDVVFVEDFEGSVDEICGRWEEVAGKPIMSKSEDVPPGSGGKQSILLTRTAGGTAGYKDAPGTRTAAASTAASRTTREATGTISSFSAST